VALLVLPVSGFSENPVPATIVLELIATPQNAASVEVDGLTEIVALDVPEPVTGLPSVTELVAAPLNDIQDKVGNEEEPPP
jgi:hypothetical protein